MEYYVEIIQGQELTARDIDLGFFFPSMSSPAQPKKSGSTKKQELHRSLIEHYSLGRFSKGIALFVCNYPDIP